jgi:hypothetical protein
VIEHAYGFPVEATALRHAVIVALLASISRWAAETRSQYAGLANRINAMPEFQASSLITKLATRGAAENGKSAAAINVNRMPATTQGPPTLTNHQFCRRRSRAPST